MTAVLYLGGVTFVVALALAYVTASTSRRYVAVALLGVGLAAAWFALVLLTASTDPNHKDCSDCEYLWGRWWWPPLVAGVIGLNLAGWLLGATAGWLVRRPRGPS
jgi:hypothetical protein